MPTAFWAHTPAPPNGAEGWRFAVWAPGATAVEVCGGFDGWERGVPMERADTGVWSAFIPGLAEGDLTNTACTARTAAW